MNKKEKVRNIFDSISHRYDLLNHLLSAGIDFYWRHKALKLTNFKKDSVLLDIACGTGDFAAAARKKGVKNIYGADLSLNMLKHFNKKTDWSRGKLVEMVAEDIPFQDNYFSNITVAFGVRNFFDIQKAFFEFKRVLNRNGKVTILEFRLPEKGIIHALYMFYFKKLLPFIGKLISKDREAYQYLPDSVEEFDQKVDLKKMLQAAGFNNVSTKSLTLGIVQVVIAEK